MSLTDKLTYKNIVWSDVLDGVKYDAMQNLFKKDYVIEIVKEVTEGQKYAGYGQYTPSKSAKLGKFMFFVQE